MTFACRSRRQASTTWTAPPVLAQRRTVPRECQQRSRPRSQGGDRRLDERIVDRGALEDAAVVQRSEGERGGRPAVDMEGDLAPGVCLVERGGEPGGDRLREPGPPRIHALLPQRGVGECGGDR